MPATKKRKKSGSSNCFEGGCKRFSVSKLTLVRMYLQHQYQLHSNPENKPEWATAKGFVVPIAGFAATLHLEYHRFCELAKDSKCSFNYVVEYICIIMESKLFTKVNQMNYIHDSINHYSILPRI